jgi:hypothetical protein
MTNVVAEELALIPAASELPVVKPLVPPLILSAVLLPIVLPVIFMEAATPDIVIP